VRIGIRATESEILQRIPNYLPPGWTRAASPVVENLYSLVVGGDQPGSHVRRYHLLYAGATRLARTLNAEDVFDALESHSDYAVAVGAPRRLFTRAGVVGWRGKAIVLPGRRSAGTTSLVAELVRAGATFYSDRYAVFDANGRVHPYSRPLRVHADNGSSAARVPIEAIGGHRGRTALPVGLVVVTEYDASAHWRPRSLSPAQAVLALMEHTIVARLRPAFTLETLSVATRGVLALKGRRGEARTVADGLFQRLETVPVA
jgi:hypothetical protein